MRIVLCLAVICLMAAPVAATHVDGSIAGDGYALSTTQTLQTEFGDNENELNAAWTRYDATTVYFTLTGNLQNNFNKLNIFIDSVPGGENVITAANDNGGNNPTNDGWANKYAGFTFQTGFAADYLIIARNGSDQFELDFNSVGIASVVEVSGDIFGGTLTGGNASVGASGLSVGFDNSNGAGILGGTNGADQSAAQAVQTGLEFGIPLAALGNPNVSDIRIVAMVNGSNLDFLSNQFLPGLSPAPQGNLGGDGAGTFTGNLSGINLNNFDRNPSFAIIPEPASLALVGLATLGLLSARRRS